MKEKETTTPTEELKETTKKAAPKSEKLQKEIDALKEEIEALKTEIKEKDDKYLRMAAEYDNFRRRSREERAAAYDDAVADTVLELLPIIDNLERAAAFDDGEKVKEGLVLTAKTVGGVLEKLKIESVGTPGETFDPNLHNAVMHVDDESFGENEVVEVFMKGYAKGDKVLRYSMVKVAN